MRTVIATDFDGTLTTADTLLRFIRFARGRWSMMAVFALYSPLLILMKLRMYSNEKVKQRIFCHFFRGMHLDEFNALCHAYAESDRRILRPGGMEMIRKAKADGHEVVIVSASIENWVQPFFPDVRVTGTQIEIRDGLLTGRFRSRNCYGEEKVKRLLEVFPDRNDYRLIAYGDSGGDKALLAFADESHYKPWRRTS